MNASDLVSRASTNAFSLAQAFLVSSISTLFGMSLFPSELDIHSSRSPLSFTDYVIVPSTRVNRERDGLSYLYGLAA